MDSITKKLFNNGRFILSIIFSFFYANVATNILQINFPKIFSLKSKSLTLAPSPPSPSVATATTTTTRRRRRKATKTPSILSSKVESSTSVVATLPPPPPLATTTTTTVTTTPILTSRMSFLFSSNSESSTSTLAKTPQLLSLLPSLATTTPITTTKTPSILSSKVESSTSVATSLPPPPPLATTTTTTITTTPIPKSRMSFIFSSKSEPSTSALAKTTPLLPLLPLSSPLATTTPITTTRTPSIISSLFDSTPYSSPWMNSTSGDLIGSESGVFMLSTNELEEYEEQYRNRKSNINIIDVPKRITQSTNVKKEYPPPIPSWRGKLIGDVPRSLSRHNVDGKLILKYERTEYSEYLEATRENGRLVIKLIVLKGK
ncbi:hypothetical protein P3S67_014238 [Capsicum chacoense]